MLLFLANSPSLRVTAAGRDGPRPSGHWTTSFPDTFEPDSWLCHRLWFATDTVEGARVWPLNPFAAHCASALLDVKASNLAVKVHQNFAVRLCRGST